jgi:ribonucleoside-diphosphate reductase alpha chain
MQLLSQRISLDVLQEKYCKGNESSVEEVRRRVAKALASIESSPEHLETVFYDAQCRGIVMAGRINSAAGTELEATLINCFVQPIADATSGLIDGVPGIYDALKDAANTMRRGGGVGYDFSRLRPQGAHVKSTLSEASGPVSYMRVFDRSCETVESAGARRGAQMGILRIDHPDIEQFIQAKDRKGELTNFNISVAVTDDFLSAVKEDRMFDLVHAAKPGPRLISEAAARGESLEADPISGLYVYKTVSAKSLWDALMKSTYDHGEPGVFFVDRVNRDNNLYYCETIEATNPCAEQCLPAYGCCCLGSINLAALVIEPFTDSARFNMEAFKELVGVSVRMLDNVLTVTYWPLDEQKKEAENKRRIGLGFLGLGDTLVMLGIPYNSQEARMFAANVAREMRDASYRYSVELAKERGAFPLFDVEAYLGGEFTKRLPVEIRQEIAKYGIRNSHLLSIAPTGTISLAFADNASNGIEPAFSWRYDRKKRMATGGHEVYEVEDFAYRVYRSMGKDTSALPAAFVSALEIDANAHALMVSAVQKYIDSSISKTVNIPADYPFEQFKDLYMTAWRSGAKSLATFRPNDVTGSLLSVTSDAGSATTNQQAPNDLDQSDPDRRIVLDKLPTPALMSLKWPRRPVFADGNPAQCYRVKHPNGTKFTLVVGHHQNGVAYPFEVWITGQEAPRALNALAINLSFDMYALDRGWLRKKLDSLARCAAPGEEFELPMPPHGEKVRVPSIVSAMATLIDYRCAQLHAFEHIEKTPLLDALMSPKEPKTGADGTMSWTVDVRNEGTGDDFVLGVKELVIETNGTKQRRPYSLWLSGSYPRALDGLCKALSLDMRVIDPAWIGKKLRELLDYAEPQGEFFAPVPGEGRQESYPSTVAYMVQLVIHRYAMVGILDKDGYPLEAMGIVQSPDELGGREKQRSVGAMEVKPGRLCESCGNYAVIKKDGCKFCTSCGNVGECG